MSRKVLIGLGTLCLSMCAFAEDGQASGVWRNVAYFLGLGLAVYGGTQAQSGAASKALEGIARNPNAADKIQTPMILGLALMESLVIFMLASTFFV